MSDTPVKDSVNGPDFLGMLTFGTEVLEQNYHAVNALNVFPVPDGDTGTNMLLTLRAIIDEANKEHDDSIGAVSKSIARGALLGARGNSGVILSQFLRGIAKVLDGYATADGTVLASAFRSGSAAAYDSVVEPVEGTILTTLRETSKAMELAVDINPVDLGKIFQSSLQRCVIAVDDTTSQLSVLQSAGVVDSGAQGFALILDGMTQYLSGTVVRAASIPTTNLTGRISEQFLESAKSEIYGYCTQFIIDGFGLDVNVLRAQFYEVGESIVVIGDTQLIRVHGHVDDPERLLRLGRQVGVISELKIEDMDTQHEEFRKDLFHQGLNAAVAVVAVVNGSGLELLFRDLGAAAIVAGGQTMNPSCQDLLESVKQVESDQIILLPNNSNVIAAARQAAGISPKRIEVVPTKSAQSGISALLAYNPDEDLIRNTEAMNNAHSAIRTGEVVAAVRDAVVDGQLVRHGQYMGLLDDKLRVVADTSSQATEMVLRDAGLAEEALVTLYWGNQVDETEVELLAKAIRYTFGETVLEVVYGGQPYYDYLISIE